MCLIRGDQGLVCFAAAADFSSLCSLMYSFILLSVEQQFLQLSTLTETATYVWYFQAHVIAPI